jgi:hypothetical protein
VVEEVVFIDNEPTKDKGPINWAKEEQLKKSFVVWPL